MGGHLISVGALAGCSALHADGWLRLPRYLRKVSRRAVNFHLDMDCHSVSASGSALVGLTPDAHTWSDFDIIAAHNQATSYAGPTPISFLSRPSSLFG